MRTPSAASGTALVLTRASLCAAQQPEPVLTTPTIIDAGQYQQSVQVNPWFQSTLAPPPAGSLAVSSSYAFRQIDAGGIDPCTARLALYSDATYGAIQPDGTVVPAYTGRLVWAFVAENFNPRADLSSMGSGPASDPGDPPRDHEFIPLYCLSTVISDAATGQHLLDTLHCGDHPHGIG